MTTNRNQSDVPGRDDIPLEHSWNLSENYQLTTQKTFQNFGHNHNSIFEFSTMAQLAMLWKYTDYSKPSNLFYDGINCNSRKFRVSETDPEEKILDALVMFKKGIKPEWEDPMNQNGCSFYCNLKDLKSDEIDNIWQDLIFNLTGASFPFIDYITGIRFIDRLKKHSTAKLEIWISVGSGLRNEDSEEYMRQSVIIKAIADHFLILINRTREVSEFELTKQEHNLQLKLN